jgi:hypothetical protein
MPSPEYYDLVEPALLWAKTSSDRYGDPVTSEPVELLVSWGQRRAIMRRPDGSKVAVDAQVAVDREVEVGSKMWLGALSDWLGTGSAGIDDEVMLVVAYEATDDLKSRDTRYVVGLARYKDG